MVAMRFGSAGHIEGIQPFDPEREPKKSEGQSAAQNVAEQSND